MTNEHESAFAQDPTITETSATAVAEETVSEPIEARADVVETPAAPAGVAAAAPVEAPAPSVRPASKTSSSTCTGCPAGTLALVCGNSSCR